MIQFDYYFSDGLVQPPPSSLLCHSGMKFVAIFWNQKTALANKVGEEIKKLHLPEVVVPWAEYICARVDQLSLFPYNRGWETQPNHIGVYRAPL